VGVGQVYAGIRRCRVSLAAMKFIGRLAISTGLLSATLLCVTFEVGAQTIAEPSFDVVSIRLSVPGQRWSFKDGVDRMTLTGVNARVLVAEAYGMKLANTVGGPAWIDGDQYDVTATFGDALMAKLAAVPPLQRTDQILAMLRSVLEQRFGLVVHHEARQVPGYALVVAKGGPKFAPAPPPTKAEVSDAGAKYNGHLWTVSREPMTFLAIQLSRIPEVGRDVIDQTGLRGDYRFNFDDPSKTEPDLSIFTALTEQLGLTLKPTKASDDFIVIDHIERPSAN
jgi:uncharacterized protein (TIGR03435 family)